MIQLGSLRQIKRRMRSVDSTKKVTHVMEMISASKLKNIAKTLSNSRLYLEGLESVLSNLLTTPLDLLHPLLENRKYKKRFALCIVTSDTGLCSSYNHNVVNIADSFIKEHGNENVKIIAVGIKGFNYFKKKGLSIAHVYSDLRGRYSNETSAEILKNLTDIFLSKEADEVFVAYTKFHSSTRHTAVLEKLLNVEPPKTKSTEYLLEPDINAILERLISEYLTNKMKIILLNSFTSEHSARLTAMSKATNNAEELFDALVVLRNKVRQANITNELLEVISSAEALKG